MSGKPRNGMKGQQQQPLEGAYPHPYVMYHQDPVTWNDYALGGADEDPFFQHETMSGEDGQLKIDVPFFREENLRFEENGERTHISFDVPEQVREQMAAQQAAQNGMGPSVPTWEQPPPEYYEEPYPPPEYEQAIPPEYQEETPWAESIYDQPQYQQEQPPPPPASAYDPAEIEAIYQMQQQEAADRAREEAEARRAAAAMHPSMAVHHSMEAEARGEAPYIYRGGGRVPADIYSPITGQPTRELSDRGVSGLFKIVFENEPCFLTESPDGGLMPYGSPPEGCEMIWMNMLNVATDGMNDQLPHDLIWFYLTHRENFITSMRAQAQRQQAQVQRPPPAIAPSVPPPPAPAPDAVQRLVQYGPPAPEPKPAPVPAPPTALLPAVQPKKRSYLPWILLGLAGAGLVWYFWPRKE